MATPSTNLATKLAEATAAITHIAKTGKNTQQGYDYVTDADVLGTLRKQLAERKVATTVGIHDVEHVPFVTGKGSPMFLTTVAGDLSFIDGETGEVISVPFRGVGSDSTDKGYYKAVTGGVKYALLKCFLVPTGDDPERDEAPKPVSSGTQTRAAVVETPTAAKVGLTDPQKKRLFALFDEEGIKESASRKHVTQTLVKKVSTKDMTNDDMDTILRFFAEGGPAVDDLKVRALAAAA